MQDKYPIADCRFTNPVFHAALSLAVAIAGMTIVTPADAQEAVTNHYDIMLKYDFGTNSASFTAMEDEARQAKPDQRAVIEKKLLGIIESPESTFPARQYACRLFCYVGSSACVPVLSKLLTDEKLSHAARIPLQVIQHRSAGKALLKALGKTGGNIRIGIINSLGVRAENSAVGDLSDLLSEKDAETVHAALNALGRIGTEKAAKALQKARVADTVRPKLYEAKITCANQLCKAGSTKLADEIFTELMAPGNPDTVRAAGFTGVVRARQEKATPFVIQTIKSDDSVLIKAACSAITSMESDSAAKALAADIAGLPAAGKIAVIYGLAGRKETGGLSSTVNAIAGDQAPEVKLAAVRAAARLGDASSVGVLAETLKSNDDLSRAAVQSLKDIQGTGVADALIKIAASGEPAVRTGVLTVLGERGETCALPIMYKAAEDPDGNVRSAAIKGLGLLAGPQDLSRLVEILIAQKNGGERDRLAWSIANVGLKIKDADEGTVAVIQGLAKADDAAKCSLLSALSKMGGGKAIEAVKSHLGSSNADIRKAAIRALSDWVDTVPMKDVLELAKNSTEENHKILALRGYIRMAGMDKHKPVKERLEWYRQALQLATRPDEKRAALGGLDQIGHIDALKLVEGYINDEKIRNEALSAYARIADRIGNSRKEEARAALQKVIENTKDQGLINRARESLEKLDR